MKKKKANITRLAREFHMFYQHLLNRYNDLNSKGSHNFALIIIEDFVVYQYIQRLDVFDMIYRRFILLRVANSMLRERFNSRRIMKKH